MDYEKTRYLMQVNLCNSTLPHTHIFAYTHFRIIAYTHVRINARQRSFIAVLCNSFFDRFVGAADKCRSIIFRPVHALISIFI